MLRCLGSLMFVLLASCAAPHKPGVGDIGSVEMVGPASRSTVVAVAPVPPTPEPAPATTAASESEPDPEPSPNPEPAPEPVPEAEPAPAVTPEPPPAPTTPAEPKAPPTPRIDVEFAGDEYRVSIDGVRVAKDHLRRTDHSIEIVASSGAVLHSIPVPTPREHPAAMICVRFETPGPALRKHLAPLRLEECSIVVAVLADGPGHAAGVEDFDIVTAVDGDAHASPAAIRTRIAELKPGDPLTLSIRRASTDLQLKIVSVPWVHAPIPVELHTPPVAIAPSPRLEPVSGAPNAPADTDARGRPAAAAQRSGAPER